MDLSSLIPSPILYSVVPFVAASMGLSYAALQLQLRDVPCVIKRGKAEKEWRKTWFQFILPVVAGVTIAAEVYGGAVRSGVVRGVGGLAAAYLA